MDYVSETPTFHPREAEMSRPDLEKELERLHPAAFGWAVRCCGGDRVAAEDALQATYLKILDGSARYAGRSAIQTWVFGVVRRTAAEQRRRGGVARWLSLDWLDAGPLAKAWDNPSEGLIRSESTRRLEQALTRLPERQRDVLHLVFYQDMSIAAAAEVLGVSLGTARTHYERGKARLRLLLPEEDT